MSTPSAMNSRNVGTARELAGIRFSIPPFKALSVPLAMLLMLAMLLLPLPPFLLDILFTFNIALALVVLIVSAYTVKPLEFAVFPSVLLLTTLLRLSLNVASTRQVLLHGHTGTDAAGEVIESFANFLIGGNFAVGIIVFSILTVINFIVVTKGAGRIAEVSARFALDAMPGKQMAIDADLNSGQIDQAEAKRRRKEVGEEADFFGSMDGASKFVRGDAIAGILILFINIVGGLIIGVTQHDLPLTTAANNYVLLAIGDALVAQVPSLVISVAAGLVVSRVSSDDDIGGQFAKQLFSMPRALGLTAIVIALLGAVPGMPHLAFFILAACCAYAAWWTAKQQAILVEPTPVASEPAADAEASWDDVAPLDALGLEVGYRLIKLVDKAQSGNLLSRIKGVRKKFASEIGFLPPAVHIRDNLELKPSAYRVMLKGVVIGEGEAFPGMLLAINPGQSLPQLPGASTVDPAFGLAATWIESNHRDSAQVAGYTVVDAATVVATHVHNLMLTNASRLLGRTETQQLLDHFNRHSPKLADELVPKLLPLATVQRVLQNLLDEAVPLRDLRGILEALIEHAPRIQDAGELTVEVRLALAHAIVQQIYSTAGELEVIALDPALEGVLMQSLPSTASGVLEPNVADFLVESASAAWKANEAAGITAALLVPDRIRMGVARLVRKAAPRLSVLAHREIPENKSIRISKIIGGGQ